jgi:hypothetical protein
MTMKLTAVVLGSILLFSCSGDSKEIAAKKEGTDKAPQNFFPLTDFIKGEIKTIAGKGVNPLKVTTIANRNDSAWLKLEALDSVLTEFTTPTIDSSNLISLFTETKFEDQTLNTYTFTYDPSGKLPDTMHLRHWDIYVDPETGTVKKVYMVKKSGNITLQLTWQTGKWCKITTLSEKPDGSNGVDKQETILWDFSSK